MSLVVTATASESSIVTQTRPLTFHAERGIFLSAEILNPFTENQILKIVLPDSTILYRDLTNNEVWKEKKTKGQSLTSSTLTEEELHLLSGLKLDTGWIPEGWALQFRLIFQFSAGKIVADLPGVVELSYDEDEIQVGKELNTQLKWIGDPDGGNLHMEGGIEWSVRCKVEIDFPWWFLWPNIYWEMDITDYIPNTDLYFNSDCSFSPFLLKDNVTCIDNSFTGHDFERVFDTIGIYNFLAEYSSDVTGSLEGYSICGNDGYFVYNEGDETDFPVQISDCLTDVEVTNKYDGRFDFDWDVLIGGVQWMEYIVPDVDSEFIYYTEDYTVIALYDGLFPLDFNEPTVQFQIEVPEPSQPSYVSPSDGATDQPQPVYLDWDDVSGADYYQVQVDNNSDFSSPVYYVQSLSSHYSVPDLADDTRYWWRVRAYNGCEGWGSWNNGTWDFTTDAPTDVAEIDSPELPEQFVLSQNYPNPFNPETRIEFALPQASHVTMDIYNVLGKRVRRLVNERLSAGWKVITWDGCDDQGNSVSSGVFFYRMAAGDIAETKKMVLLK